MTSDHATTADETAHVFELKPADLQMTSYREWLDSEIARAFSIDPRLLEGRGHRKSRGLWG
jgi:hypothetical protein